MSLRHAKHRARSPHLRSAPVAGLVLAVAGCALTLVATRDAPGTVLAASPRDRDSIEVADRPRPDTVPVLRVPTEDERLRQSARASRSRRSPSAVPSPTAPPAAVRAPVPTVVTPPPPAVVRPGDGARTSGFGQRWGRLHAGVDLASGTGAPVRAAAAGTVLSAGQESGYGQCVRITHPDGTVTLYAHMSALLVEPGTAVTAGQQIGREGNTGRSTGPHLHFEVRIDGAPVNPAPWLQARGVVV